MAKFIFRAFLPLPPSRHRCFDQIDWTGSERLPQAVASVPLLLSGRDRTFRDLVNSKKKERQFLFIKACPLFFSLGLQIIDLEECCWLTWAGRSVDTVKGCRTQAGSAGPMVLPTASLTLACGGFRTRAAGKRLCVSCSLEAALVVYAPPFPLAQTDQSYFPSSIFQY